MAESGAPSADGAEQPAPSTEPKLWADEEDEFADLRKRVTRSYIFEERCAAAVRLKEEGNVLLNAGDYEEASRKYEEGLFHADFDEFQRMELLDEHRLMLQSVRLPLLLNSVLCALKMNPEDQMVRLATAEARCAEVLKAEPNNAKAQFRRAQLHARAGEDEQARALFEALCLAHPTERAFRAELSAHTERMRKARKVQDKFWAEALRKQAAQAERERPSDASGGAHRPADDEPCLTSGRGPLSARHSLQQAAEAAAELPLSGPLMPLLSALRGVSYVGSTLWDWCAQLLWAETAHDVAAAAARSKRDE